MVRPFLNDIKKAFTDACFSTLETSQLSASGNQATVDAFTCVYMRHNDIATQYCAYLFGRLSVLLVLMQGNAKASRVGRVDAMGSRFFCVHVLSKKIIRLRLGASLTESLEKP